MCHRPVALQTSSVAGTATTIVSLCTSMPTNRVDCSMTRPPVPEAPRQTIRRDPRSSTHRDDGSPLQAGYGHEVFGAEDDQGRYVKPSNRRGFDRGVSLVRYADDLVVTAPTREVLPTYVVPKLAAFLGERGLKLSEVKTRIVHVDDGFDFLGFTVRRYRGVVLTRPQKAKVVQHLRTIHDYLSGHRQATASQVIGELNPLIRGWANYYRHGA